MLNFSSGLKVFVALEPCDMRRGYDGLWALAQERLGQDPRQGGLFVFSNRGRTRLKILYFDGTGVCVLSKRLEAGTFAWPKSAGSDPSKLQLSPAALQLLIDGIQLRDAGRRAWYEVPSQAVA